MDNVATNKDIVDQFHAAMNDKDLAKVLALFTEDCIFENTMPAPDGTRLMGIEAVSGFFSAFLSSNPKAKFEPEEIFCADDRCVVLSNFNWGDGHVRGAQIIRIRDGKICETLAYVKG